VRLGGDYLLLLTLQALSRVPEIGCLVVALPPGERDGFPALVGGKPVLQVAGGATRQESVARCFEAAPPHPLVVIHDGARPFVSPSLVSRVIEEAEKGGAALAALPVFDTLKVVDGEGVVLSTPPRGDFWLAQTPQAFRWEVFREAVAKARQEGVTGTDDAALVERLGVEVRVVRGEESNFKVTTPYDLQVARVLAGGRFRTGIGYDVHPFEEGQPLCLGGVTIPGFPGLRGHSDGDAVLHAVMDACLGAAGLGDIGLHFPPGEERYRGVSSLSLLRRVRELVEEAGYRVRQVDVTVAAERPRLSPFFPAMREAVAGGLGLSPAAVGVKATTQEGLGFVGRGEGVAAWAVALVEAEVAPL